MAKKFDTNPLDPDFPEKVRETETAQHTSTLRNRNGATRKFADPVETEEQTRKFNEAEFGNFDPGFRHEGDPNLYPQPQRLYEENPDINKKHNIGSISLPENVLLALPYIPFGPVGIIASVIELVFIPKSEPRIRYHAAQGLAAQLGIWLVLAILGSVEMFGLDGLANIFWIISTIIMVVFAFKAWKGKPIHIEPVESVTDWLEEKIKPQG
jgi:uncharacterized membrane protein